IVHARVHEDCAPLYSESFVISSAATVLSRKVRPSASTSRVAQSLMSATRLAWSAFPLRSMSMSIVGRALGIPMVFSSRAPLRMTLCASRRLRDAIQETLHCILLEDLLKRDAIRLRCVAQPREHGGHDILHFLCVHSMACR